MGGYPGWEGTLVRYPPQGGTLAGGVPWSGTPLGGTLAGGVPGRVPPGGYPGGVPGQVPPWGGTQSGTPHPPRGYPGWGGTQSGTPRGVPWLGGYPGQEGGYPVRYPPGGTLAGGVPSQVPPRPGQDGGGTQVGQQKEYSLHGGRYASCIYAGLSCLVNIIGP